LRLALVAMLLPLLGRGTQNSARGWFRLVEAGENQRWLLYFSRKKLTLHLCFLEDSAARMTKDGYK
jgi:hypothetical protein